MADDCLDRLHWNRVEMDWSGRGFTLMVPNAFTDWPAAWLDAHLEERLRADARINRGGAPAVRVYPADWSDSGVDRWGSIQIAGLIEPLPDAAALREVVNEAVIEAHRSADEAARISKSYLEAVADRHTT